MNTLRTLLTLIAFSAMSLTCYYTHAEMVQLSPVKDNTLYEDPNGLLSNGAGEGIFAGKTGFRGPGIVRGLMLFDIDASVPQSATITGATLSINVSKAATSFPDPLNFHRLTADWGEADSIADKGSGGGGAGGDALAGDATWTDNFFGSSTWSNLGGDFETTSSATKTIFGSGSYTWNMSSLIPDIQDMLNEPENDFGWILRGNEAIDDATAWRIDSRESSDPPLLTIEYDLPVDFDADFDNDNDVDGDDLDYWTAAFGAGNVDLCCTKPSCHRPPRRNPLKIAIFSAFSAHFGLANTGKLRTIRSLFGLVKLSPKTKPTG